MSDGVAGSGGAIPGRGENQRPGGRYADRKSRTGSERINGDRINGLVKTYL